MMSGAEMILQLKNITKTYPGVVALNDVTIDIARNEVHALVGENGAGKSTLIKTCTGAVVPDSGNNHRWRHRIQFNDPQTVRREWHRRYLSGIQFSGSNYQSPKISFSARAIRKGIVIDRKAMVGSIPGNFRPVGDSYQSQ